MAVDTARSPDRESRAGAAPGSTPAAAWPHLANVALGVAVAASAFAHRPHPPALRASEAATGLLVALLSGLACLPRFGWAPWLVGGLGVWLMTAPLVFWAPTAAAYGADTACGALVVAFALFLPGTPGARDLPGPDVPPGWSYNPSAWPQRAGIIAVAFAQFLLAAYMASYQLGHLPDVWDPAFGPGTRNVLDSEVSKAFPVSDAGLGALSFLIEGLTGFLGGPRRWRAMPWAVLLFGVLIIPVGVVSIVLVVLQPVAVGAWCSPCLLTALLTVFMISPAADEVVATLQFLLRARREGDSTWRAFWLGGRGDSPGVATAPKPREPLWRELAGGMELDSVPWNLAACAAVGLALLVAPAALGHAGAVAASNYLSGALVATFSVVGFGEAARPTRLLNLPLGVWLMLSPAVLPGHPLTTAWVEVVAGLAVILLSLRRGPVRNRFGGWDRLVA